ncbi:DUF2306 domain-containing protein [Cytophaga aurantiaca]|uniref:DUF2306 domain-containing protein n=1 Tax=Cytophaga aurantiaca TaxID=29530 RepID=UPI000376D018|nr:DUF2306 domain-containing protein [Cytophaga aurantiaca]
MKAIVFDALKTIFIYTILCVATFLISTTILEYTSFNEQAAFLKYKQEYLHITSWKIAFYIHVFTSIFCLIAGFTQFSKSLQTEYPALHRFIGKVYVFNILVINFPAALIMAYYANGLLPTKIAFTILDCLWFWFTLKAFLEVKKRNFKSHENYMIRSYALTFSAITLRTWKLILSSTTDIDPDSLYMINAWLGFVPNLLAAEYYIWMKNKG